MTTPENQCNGKHQYETIADANRAVARLNDKGGKRMSSYSCPDCGYFHYGHNGKGKRLPKAEKSYTVNINHESKTHIAQRRFIK